MVHDTNGGIDGNNMNTSNLDCNRRDVIHVEDGTIDRIELIGINNVAV